MDVDIRKPDTGIAQFERPAPTTSSNTPNAPTPRYTEPLSEGEEDEEFALHIAPDEDKITGLPPEVAAVAISHRESFLRRKAEEEENKQKSKQPKRSSSKGGDRSDDEDGRTPFLRSKRGSVPTAERPRNLSIYPLVPSSQFDKDFKSKVTQDRNEPVDVETTAENEEGSAQGQTSGRQNGIEYVREWRAQDGKRIAVPVRIEPKVYFAAERTFLVNLFFTFLLIGLEFSQRWLQFSVVIGSIATLLLNFTKPDDNRALISAAAFTLAALLSIAYSCVIFVYRAYRLRNRSAEGLYYGASLFLSELYYQVDTT